MSGTWPKVQLGKVLRERRETPDATDVAVGNIPIVSKIGFNTGLIKLRSKIGSKTNMILVKPGDLLVSGINAAKGAIAVYDEANIRPTAATIHYSAYEVDTEKTDTNYLWRFLRSEAFRKILIASLPTGIKTELKARRLLSLEIPLPPLGEQRRIVAKIEQLSGKVAEVDALHQRAIEEAEVVLSSQLNRLFGNPYLDLPGDFCVNDWRRIDEVAYDVADGPHVTPQYVDDGVPFITVKNIISGRVRFENHKYITRTTHEQLQNRARVEKGDVLISKDGTIGIPCYVDTDREFSFFVSVALVKPKREILDGEFLAWAIHAPYLQERIVEKSRGDMIRHLVLREIRDLTIPVPSLPEQRRIVGHLNDLHRRIDVIKKLQDESAGEIRAVMASVLDRVFRNKAHLSRHLIRE